MGLRMRRMSSAELGSRGPGAGFSAASVFCGRAAPLRPRSAALGCLGCPGCEVLASSPVRQLSAPAAHCSVLCEHGGRRCHGSMGKHCTPVICCIASILCESKGWQD